MAVEFKGSAHAPSLGVCVNVMWPAFVPTCGLRLYLPAVCVWVYLCLSERETRSRQWSGNV
eukprot:3565325-Lingulodinium_polyedra.AAC.1